MSGPSDDRASDEDSKEEPAATSGEAEVHRVDTVPPPASGDAYSADTVIRDVPREALEAIRDKRKNSEKRRAADASESEPASEKTAEAEKSEEPTKAEEPKKAPAIASPKAPTKAETKSPAHAAAPAIVIEPPVTSGELTIAFAAAVALIVIGFYAIGSAF